MVDQHSLLIECQVFSRAGIGRQYPLVKAHKVLDDGQLKIESRLLEDAFGVAKLDDHALLPFTDGKRGLREGKDDNQPEADNESSHDAYLLSALAFTGVSGAVGTGEAANSFRGSNGTTPPLVPLSRMNFSIVGIMRSILSR